MSQDQPGPPIEVHCPSPTCARVHRVKSKYAGMRGKCPACQSWMYVPAPPAPPAVSTLGWAPVVFLVAGMMSLGVVALAPALPGHRVEATGTMAAILGAAPPAVPAEVLGWAIAVPLLLLALPLGALVVGVSRGRPTVLTRWLTYAALALSSVLAVVTMQHHHDQMALKTALEQSVEQARLSGIEGNARFVPGVYLYAGLGGACGAACLFLLAAFALHRRVWSRIVGTLVLGSPLAAVSVWLYRRQLGLESFGSGPQ